MNSVHTNSTSSSDSSALLSLSGALPSLCGCTSFQTFLQMAEKEDLAVLLLELASLNEQQSVPFILKWCEDCTTQKEQQEESSCIWRKITCLLQPLLEGESLNLNQEEEADRLLSRLHTMEKQKQIPEPLRSDMIRCLTKYACACIPPYEDVLWEILKDFICSDEDRIIMYSIVLERGDVDFACDLIAALAYERAPQEIARLVKRIFEECPEHLRTALMQQLYSSLELPEAYMKALYQD